MTDIVIIAVALVIGLIFTEWESRMQARAEERARLEKQEAIAVSEREAVKAMRKTTKKARRKMRRQAEAARVAREAETASGRTLL